MSKFILLVAVIIISTLACSIPATSLVAATPSLVAEPNIESKPVATQETAIVTAARSLNVRERAGVGNRVIDVLSVGNSVKLTGACLNGWAEIRWKNKTAWVNADYLSDNFCKED